MRIVEIFNLPIKECTTAGSVAVAVGGGKGNGFVNGGPGTISRTNTKKKKSKK
jgi:hypothetical protein